MYLVRAVDNSGLVDNRGWRAFAAAFPLVAGGRLDSGGRRSPETVNRRSPETANQNQPDTANQKRELGRKRLRLTCCEAPWLVGR
ncbi:hypothetical protein H4W33_005420 [Kibdelosporangium phytohabitans]|nr:hypothetical protein [Kibdelosporangium phytohabitans]